MYLVSIVSKNLASQRVEIRSDRFISNNFDHFRNERRRNLHAIFATFHVSRSTKLRLIETEFRRFLFFDLQHPVVFVRHLSRPTYLCANEIYSKKIWLVNDVRTPSQVIPRTIGISACYAAQKGKMWKKSYSAPLPLPRC